MFLSKDHVLFLLVYGTNGARPAWISSYSAAVQDSVGFHLCSPLKVMSLIKHTLSSAGRAVFLGKSLVSQPAGAELGSSAGCGAEGQPFPCLRSLPSWMSSDGKSAATRVVNLHRANVCGAAFSQRLPKDVELRSSGSCPSLPVSTYLVWRKTRAAEPPGLGRCALVAWHSAAAGQAAERLCLLLCSAGCSVHPPFTCLNP